MLIQFHSIFTTQVPLLKIHYLISTAQFLVHCFHYSVSTTQFPLLSFHYSVPTTQNPLLSSHNSVPTTQFPLLSSHYSVPATQFPLLSSTTHFHHSLPLLGNHNLFITAWLSVLFYFHLFSCFPWTIIYLLNKINNLTEFYRLIEHLST